MGRYRLSSCALTLALTALACGGKIAGETDPLATRVTGTKTGTPEPPADDPVALPPVNEPATPPPSTPPQDQPTVSPFAWSPSCPVAAPPWVSGTVSLEATRTVMVGRWTGTATTPWIAPYTVYIELEAGGHYASRSTSGAAFYWGNDFDTDLKKWSLIELEHPTGLARGSIDVTFGEPGHAYLPLWQGLLRSLHVDAVAARLAFDVLTSDGYGPIHYDLWRCP